MDNQREKERRDQRAKIRQYKKEKSEMKNRKTNKNSDKHYAKTKKGHTKDKKVLLHKDSIPTFPLCKVSKLIVFYLSYFCSRYT